MENETGSMNRRQEIERLFARASELAEEQRQIEKKVRDILILEITDHALLRYAERLMGFDSRKVILKIITPELIALYKKFGDGTFPCGDGFSVVIRKGKIITILLDKK